METFSFPKNDANMAEVNEANRMYPLPLKDPQRCMISPMGHCSIGAVCVNLEQIEKLRATECVKDCIPLLRLHWQGRDNAVDRVSYITISKVKEDCLSTAVIDSDLALCLVKDNQAIREIATKISSTYNMWLTTVDYPPLVLTFQHSNGHCTVNLAADKSILTAIVRAFLTREEPKKTETKYQVSVHTGYLENENRSCHCFGLFNDKKEKFKKRSQLLSSPMLPSHVEEKFQSIEEELSQQKMLISVQLEEQQKQYDDICSNIMVITECLNQKTEKNTQDNTVLKHGDRKKAVQFKPLVTSEHNDSSVHRTKHEEKLTDQGDQVGELEHVAEVGKRKDDDEEEKEMSNQMNQNKCLEMKTRHKGRCNDDRNRPDLYTTEGQKDFISTEVSENTQVNESVKTEKELKTHVPKTYPAKSGIEELTSKTSTTVDNIDVPYSDIHGPAAPHIGYQCEKRLRYGDQYRKHKQPAPGNKAKTLVVPCDVYNNPQLMSQSYTQDFRAGSGSSDALSLHSNMAQAGRCYPSTYDAFPDIQTDRLNFDMTQINLLLAAGIARTSEGTNKEKLWANHSGQQKLRTMVQCMIDDSPCRQRLLASFEEAMQEDCSPRVDHAMDTVICLDTSGSMAGDPFQTLKGITLDFIDGIEDMAQKYDIEENIALVTFGGRAKVIHHLSNDYESLREAVDTITPGGPGPMLEGLVVSMACLHKGGRYQIDLIKLPPRLVFISDGYPTREMPESNQDSSWVSEQDMTRITNAFDELVSRQLDDGLPSPVIFVPVGTTVSMNCLKQLAWHSGGEVINPEVFPELSKYQRLQKIATDALRCIRSRGLGTSIFQSGFHDFVSQLGADVNDSDAEQIYDMVRKNMGKMIIDYGAKCSLDNVHEEQELPPLGSRVVRGPDWKWGNQDTEGAGTILNHSCDKMVWVCWDNDHVNVYRYGNNGKYDIVTVDDQPRLPEGCSTDVGVQVQRGPDWHQLYGDQDGGLGHHGVVIRMDHTGKVMVRWQNGEKYVYRCGNCSKYDVVVCDPPKRNMQEELDIPEATPVERSDGKDALDKDKPNEWQRKDVIKGWDSYSNENNEKLKRAYLKNPHGSCLVQRNGQSFRVSFKTLQERSIEEKTLVPVRQHLPDYHVKTEVGYQNEWKPDVSLPTDSRHISHVGQDPDKGFDLNYLEEDMKMLFHSVGIMQSDKVDNDTLKFIRDFVEKNGGIEVVRKQMAGRTNANS